MGSLEVSAFLSTLYIEVKKKSVDTVAYIVDNWLNSCLDISQSIDVYLMRSWISQTRLGVVFLFVLAGFILWHFYYNFFSITYSCLLLFWMPFQLDLFGYSWSFVCWIGFAWAYEVVWPRYLQKTPELAQCIRAWKRDHVEDTRDHVEDIKSGSITKDAEHAKHVYATIFDILSLTLISCLVTKQAIARATFDACFVDTGIRDTL